MTRLRAFALAVALFLVVAHVRAQTPPPDESILGTVEVDGSESKTPLPPLPKLAIVPLPSTTAEGGLLNLVLRRDLELSGQFQLLDDAAIPPGPFTRDAPLDLRAFGDKGAEYIVRAYAETTGAKTHLVAEAFLPPKAGAPAPPEGAPPPKPAYTGAFDVDASAVRPMIHRLVDALIGALTGREGGFASKLAYAARVGQWSRAYVLDADGFDLHADSPTGVTILSPTFGPGGYLFYALSADYSPFRLAEGKDGLTFPFTLPGSLMGLSFSSDRTRLALVLMTSGRSSLMLAEPGKQLSQVGVAPNANHPALGPLGKIAYAGGTPVQRIYVDGKPISPPGLMASAPAFCDGPQGLLVLFTVQVAGGADLVATDTTGGGLRRLTQRQGSNTYAACSPDGRLVAFFSTTKTGKGSGLYLMPIARPWLAKKISSEVGDTLRWERTTH